MNADTLRDLVTLCRRDGHLYGARPSTASRTLTVRGKRRLRIRLQADICAALLGVQDGIAPYYPDLSPDVTRYVNELRSAS